MSKHERVRQTIDVVGTVAVVVSLVYVGVQVRQNTSAIHTSTSQSVFTQYMDAKAPSMESPELAELIVRADSAPGSLSLADSLRYELYLDFEINLYEAIYTNVAQGTMDLGMASGWLGGMAHWRCRSRAEEFWRGYSEEYAPIFQVAMDSVFAHTDCSG